MVGVKKGERLRVKEEEREEGGREEGGGGEEENRGLWGRGREVSTCSSLCLAWR